MTALLVALLLAPPTLRQDPVKVSASLSSERIYAGEQTTLQIVIEASGNTPPDAIDVADFPPAFEIAGSQDFSQYQVSVPGGRTLVVRRNISFYVRAPGVYEIPPVVVRIGGDRYRTRRLSLTVLGGTRPGGAAPPPPSMPGVVSPYGPAPASDIRLRAWLDPDTVYVGQQVLLSAETLFPDDLRQRQSRPATYEAPSPPGFWIQDLPEALTVGLRTLNGRAYETQTFRRAYFPLTPGTYRFPPARIVYEIRRGFLYAPESRELVSDSLRVVVLPLPEQGKPEAFTGAVGRYSIRARLTPDSVAAGDAATLRVDITGTGNVKALPPPKLPALDGAEVYPPTEDASVEFNDETAAGSKHFTWVVVPTKGGKLTIPGIEYGFFDPSSRSYRTARSDDMTLAVAGGAVPVRAAAADTAMRFIRLEPEAGGDDWVKSPIFAALQIVPLLLLVGAALLRRSRTTVRTPSRRRLRAARRQELDQLRATSATMSDAAFCATLTTAMGSALTALLGRPAMRGASLRRSLTDRGTGEATARAVEDFLARLERARFAGETFEAATRRVLVDTAGQLLDRVEREMGGKRPAGATVACVLLALTFAGAAPLGAQVPPAESFRAGVEAARSGDYPAARDAFESYVAARPTDAAGWYDLGNAYYASGDRGRAVWAWLRAIRRSPRDADARHNLAIAAGGAAETFLPPIWSLTRRDAVLALALIWWAAALPAAWLHLRRGRGIGMVAVAAVLAAMCTGGLAAPLLSPGPTLVAIAETVPVMAGPTLKAEEVDRLAAGTPVRVVSRQEGWVRVRTGRSGEGWVEAALLAEV